MLNNQKIKQILVIIATFGVIFINYLAAIGKINNTDPGAVSDRYPTIITPAGYAFSIWSLVYVGLIAFSIYQALPSKTAWFANIRTIYILNCAANCAWIYLWHYGFIGSSIFVMLLILGTLILINSYLLKANSTAEYILARLPFNIYFGWITVAAIANATIMFAYLGVETSEAVTKILGIILLLIATGLGILIRIKQQNIAYPLVIAWALTAIAVEQSGKTSIVVTCAVCVIILLIAATSALIQTKNSVNE